MSPTQKLHLRMTIVGFSNLPFTNADRNSPSQLWENLINKRDVQREVPNERHRFNVDTWYHPNHSNKGTVRYEIQTLVPLHFISRDWANAL